MLVVALAADAVAGRAADGQAEVAGPEVLARVAVLAGDPGTVAAAGRVEVDDPEVAGRAVVGVPEAGGVVVEGAGAVAGGGDERGLSGWGMGMVRDARLAPGG